MKMPKMMLLAMVGTSLAASGFAADTATQVFRSVDAQGNVVFMDTPREGAKPVDVQQPSSVQAITPPPRVESVAPASQEPSAFAGYQALVITQPENGAALNNTDGHVNVSIMLDPALRTDLGHSLTVTMDSKPVLQNSAQANVSLSNVDRGEHVLEAFVVNASGQVIFMSAQVRFSLQRTSVFMPGRANQNSPAHGVPAPRAAP